MAVTPLSANAPQTTPSTVDDQIQPNATDQSTPMAPPLAQPTSAPTGVPSTASQVPVQPTAPKAPVATQTAPPRKALFDRILQSMTGGPSYVTDPHTGTTSEVPMTRATLSRHILAGALTGIIAGAQAGATAPAGPAGTMGPANAAALGAGFGATNAKMQEMRNAPQAAIDADTLRKQRAMQNNLFELQNQVAISKLNDDNWERTEDLYNKSKDIFQPVLQDWQRSDTDRAAGEPSLFVEGARKLGHEEAMKMMEGHHGEYMAIQDGWTTQDINGHTAHVPTYSLVRANTQVNVTRTSLEALAPYNKDVANLLASKTGDINLPMSATQLLHMEKDAHQGIVAEHFVNDIRAAYDEAHKNDKGYKPLGQVKDFKTMYRDNDALHNQVDQMMSDLGAYGTQSPVSALEDIMSKGRGSAIVDAIGVNRTDLANYVTQSKENVKSAGIEQEGMAKAKSALMAKGITSIKNANAILANPGSSDEMKQWAQTYVDLEEHSETELAGKKAEATKLAQTAALSNNPQTLQEASNIVTGDFGKMSDIAGRGGPERQALLNALHNEAQWRGLNPADYGAAALTSKGELISEYTGKGKTRANLTAFDTFLGHASDARAAADMMQRKGTTLGGVPIMRVARKELATKLTGDPDWTSFATALLPVRKEYMTFLNAGFAEKEEDVKDMKTVLDDTKTPEQTVAALTSLAKSADVRVAALGRTFLGTIGTTMPNLISQHGKDALKSFGTGDESITLSTALPRGNDQVLDVNKHAKELQTFMKVAGGNKEVAKDLAKKNGWFLTPPGPRPGVVPQPETPANPNGPAKQAGAENVWSMYPTNEALAKTIAEHENADPKLNNEGGLKFANQPHAEKTDSGLAKFDTSQAGHQALLNQLAKYRREHKDWSVNDFVGVYSPDKEHGGDNPSGTEAAYVEHLRSNRP